MVWHFQIINTYIQGVVLRLSLARDVYKKNVEMKLNGRRGGGGGERV